MGSRRHSQIGRGKIRKKCRNAAGRNSSATVPVVSTNESTHEYDAGRRRQTRNSMNRLHMVANTRDAGSRGCRTTTNEPTRKKVNPRITAARYATSPTVRRPSSTSTS
jgi:hypothetical protein